MGLFSCVRRGAVVLAVPLMVPLMLAVGCGGPPPDAGPSERVSVSPSPAVTGPVAPELPETAGQLSGPGFKAFVEYYVAMIGYAHTFGDVDPLRELSNSGCRWCAGGLAYLDAIAADGGHVEFTSGEPTVKIKRVFVNGSAANSLSQATGTLTLPAGRAVYPAGGPPSKKVVATSRVYIFTGVWMDTVNGWRIVEVTPR